jgi:hypothetical protein
MAMGEDRCEYGVVSHRTRKTNVHYAIVPVATLIGVDWFIPLKLDES